MAIVVVYLEMMCLRSKSGSSKGDQSESHSVMSDSLRTHGLQSPRNSPGQNTEVGSHSPLQGIFPTQGLNPGVPHCKQILYQLSHQGPKNTRVGSLSLLQQIFPAQESNWALLHCRWIFYQVSYQGSPKVMRSGHTCPEEN